MVELLIIANVFLSLAGVVWAVISISFIRKLMKELEQENMNYMNFRLEMHHKVVNIFNAIRSIDIRGSFEADDEVGDVYGQIRRLVNQLSEFTLEEESDEKTT